MSTSAGRARPARDRQRPLGQPPFTLVLELDAGNIRARDDWGQCAQHQAAEAEPSAFGLRLLGGTCFRLSQRVRTAGGRPEILRRGYAMTRGGVAAHKGQLQAKAQRHGLGRASAVLIVADGAVWICRSGAGDRFPGARRPLWSVAHPLQPDEAADRAWVAPLLATLQADSGCAVIIEWAQLRDKVEGAARERVERKTAHPQTHRFAWPTGRPRRMVNRWAVGRWPWPVGNTQFAANAPANSGTRWAPKSCWVWECFVAIVVGRSSSLTPKSSPPPETDLRPSQRQAQNILLTCRMFQSLMRLKLLPEHGFDGLRRVWLSIQKD